MRICLLSSIAPEFTFRFKQAEFVEMPDERAMVASAHPGPAQRCEVYLCTYTIYTRLECHGRQRSPGTGPALRGLYHERARLAQDRRDHTPRVRSR